MDLEQVRNRYLKFFERQGHTIIPSASLVPENDPTTLFTGAGMQPILPYLLGTPHPQGQRVVNSQKCFRAEDMDEVGDNRHTTFFEMLGNWSLGDYFKDEQLPWFFSFLTDDLGISAERLYVTVFAGDNNLNLPKDTASAALWKELFKAKRIDAKEAVLGSVENGSKIGMDGARIFYYDATKNWWSRAGAPEHMPVGEPGGPDSEVFYEFTNVVHDKKFGEHCHVNCDCGRFLEIGNSVFMEYVKAPDGSFKQLPQKNVDFGGGLERLTSALANSPDVFRVGILYKTITLLEKASMKIYMDSAGEIRRSFRIVADHLRAAVFISADGVTPGNKDRGYILRRLIRRALLNGKRLGLSGTHWLGDIIALYAESYKDFYGEIDDKQEEIRFALETEAEKFLKTLELGLKQFERSMKDGALSTEDIFNLYQSYGFPEELSIELAAERGIAIDKAKLDSFKQQHSDLSRSGSEKKFKGGLADASEMTTRLHTAHHLLLKALQLVLGPEVKQRGSNITKERLRIDFSHHGKLTSEQKEEVERIVNGKIKEHLPVIRTEMAKEDAEKLNAEHEFGAKYPDRVSIYSIGELPHAFSIEFCGGPHVKNTKEIGGCFTITKEEAVSQGVRRIKAILKS